MLDLSELRIPEQSHEKSWFDVRPKAIANWIEGLPLGDSEETSKQLFAVLTHINRVRIPAPARLKALELLYPIYRLCLTAMRKYYSGKTFPLSERSMKAVDRAIAMHAEYAVGFKIAAIDLQSRHALLGKKMLTHAIYSAMAVLKDILLTHYQIYAPEPPKTWSQLHTLYDLAEQKGLLRKPLKPILSEQSHVDIESLYKHILLLSVANPYHLGNADILRVDQLLNEWSSFARLLNPNRVTSGAANFIIHLGHDRAPVAIDMIRTIDKQNSLFINTNDLVQHLRFLLSQIRTEFESATSDQALQAGRLSKLYTRLLDAWESRGKRCFSRTPAANEIDISLGLNSTHHLIEEDLRWMQQAEEEEEIIFDDEMPVVNDLANPLDIHHTTFSIEPLPGDGAGGQYWHTDTSDTVPGATTGEQQNKTLQQKFECRTWKTVNVGAGGYCLQWDQDSSSNAQIGELVGIRETSPSGEETWRIGVVRWMQYLRHQGVRLGIQVLAPKAEPVTSRLMRGRASKKQEFSCLRLPEIKSIHQSESLVTPSTHYKVGDTVVVNDHGKMINVQLTRLIENTGNFSRFQFSPLNPRENKQFEQEMNQQNTAWDRLW